eukprot:Skav205282  [mRNA]  locus=scaffold1690:116736:121725:+ [translate_table: standard]
MRGKPSQNRKVPPMLEVHRVPIDPRRTFCSVSLQRCSQAAGRSEDLALSVAQRHDSFHEFTVRMVATTCGGAALRSPGSKDTASDARNATTKSGEQRGSFHLVILTGMIIEGVNDAHNVSGQKLQRALLEVDQWSSGAVEQWPKAEVLERRVIRMPDQ